MLDQNIRLLTNQRPQETPHLNTTIFNVQNNRSNLKKKKMREN